MLNLQFLPLPSPLLCSKVLKYRKNKSTQKFQVSYTHQQTLSTNLQNIYSSLFPTSQLQKHTSLQDYENLETRFWSNMTQGQYLLKFTFNSKHVQKFHYFLVLLITWSVSARSCIVFCMYFISLRKTKKNPKSVAHSLQRNT